MLLAALAFAVGALLAGLVVRLVIARADPELSDRALRAETALAIAQVGLATAREEGRVLSDQLATTREQAAAAWAQLGEARAQVERERVAVVTQHAQLRDTFQSLAAEALAGANAQFRALAEGGLKHLVEKADGSLEQRQKAVGDLVAPLREALGKLNDEQRRIADTRSKEAATFSAELQGLRLRSDQLQTETQRLVTALRAPQVRGRWGEIQLRRTVELAGMSEHCDFVEQESVRGEAGLRRPDMVVKLPRGREVVVDSKVPLTHYLEAIEAVGEDARQEALKRHAQLVRDHVTKLADKRYWAQFDAADFVVMFMPNDGFLAAAAERDPDLLEWAIEAGVVLSTPMTFIALLRIIAAGWREERLAENAAQIAALGRDLYDRIATMVDHLNDIGGGLTRSVKAFNRTVGSMQSRVLPQAQKFQELGAAGEQEIAPLAPVDEVPRELN